MDHRAISQVVILILLLLLLVSCSTRQLTENDPIAGDLTNHQSQTGMSTGHNLMGYWNLAFDLDSGEVETVPARIVSDHLNIVRLLENMTCFQVISLKNLGENSWQVTIRITHPFPMPEYTVFDVRGIMMFDGSRTFAEFGLVMPDRLLGDGELVNADGYSTLYNGSTIGEGPGGLQGYIEGNLATPEIPDATLNGYRRHYSGYVSNTRNALLISTFVDAQYELAFPSPPNEFVIGYAVDGSWAPPDQLPVEDPMLDFPVEANCSEAWKLELNYEPIGGGITDQGGQGRLFVDVYDHQGPDTIGGVQVECAELIDGVFGGTWVADFPGYSRYEVILENGNLAAQGEYTALISVEDIDNDPAKPWLDLTAYQVFTVEVGEFIPQAQPPVAIATADPLIAYVDESIHFYDDGSFNPDGTIVLYEWDWDNDGVFDEPGSESWHFWTFPGTFQIQFRVTDNDDSTDVLDTPLQIIVEEEIDCLDLKEVGKSSYGSAYSQTMEVIKDQATWLSWWAVAADGPNPPPIDWETEMVIAVTMGQFNTGGYYPTVDFACLDDKDELEISIGWHHPGPDCMVIMVFTQPWLAVKTDRLDVSSYFADYIDIYNCG